MLIFNDLKQIPCAAVRRMLRPCIVGLVLLASCGGGGGGGNSGGALAGTEAPLPFTTRGTLLEDFHVLRLNGEGNPLWSPYLGEDPGQSGHLEGSSYRIDVGGEPNGVYLEFLPRDGGYPYPSGYAQAFVSSGTFDHATNRLSFWVKSSRNVTRQADGSDVIQIGTYIRNHSDPDLDHQGEHFYHLIDSNVYAGRWMLVELNRVPQHKVGEDPTINWPENPEAPAVDYYDGLTRFYFDSQGDQFSNSSWWFADFGFATIAGEPDPLVSSLTATYSGTNYEVTWAGPKNRLQQYSVRYSATSMHTGGFGSGIDGGTVTNPGNDYTGTFWQSPPMPQGSVLYVAIQPKGSSSFTELAIPQR